MKKTPQKLVLRKDTVRALATADLARAVGGSDSGAVACSNLFDTGDKACELQAALLAAPAGG